MRRLMAVGGLMLLLAPIGANRLDLAATPWEAKRRADARPAYMVCTDSQNLGGPSFRYNAKAAREVGNPADPKILVRDVDTGAQFEIFKYNDPSGYTCEPE